MKDRLIELIENVQCTARIPWGDDFRGKLADYLLANGVIVPPCKLNTHIFVIPTKENGLTEITEMVVRGFMIGEPCNVANCFRVRGTSALFQPSFEQFGKTVFFTKEEVEQKLKEMSQ